MEHIHIGLGDKVLRCTPTNQLAARQVTSLVRTIALEHEDACKRDRRCGWCNWCRSAEVIWETFPDELIAPLVRASLGVGLMLSWELMSPVGMIDVIWAGPAGGDYASCSAVSQHISLVHPKE